jgi:hypothetical protein
VATRPGLDTSSTAKEPSRGDDFLQAFVGQIRYIQAWPAVDQELVGPRMDLHGHGMERSLLGVARCHGRPCPTPTPTETHLHSPLC